MKIDLSLKKNYHIEVLNERGFSNDIYYFPHSTKDGGKDGVMIEVSSVSGDWWNGIFAFGIINPNAISGVFSMPNPDKFCVVSKGIGYIITYNIPGNHELVSSTPIMDVHVIESLGIIIFASHTDLIAYDKNGIKWQSERLSYDSFKIVEIANNKLKGEFWNIRSEINDEFILNLLTGSLEKGSEIDF